jgi:hypothetical protein
MARDPNQRFRNVAELAEALSPLDVVSPESDAERIRRRLDAAEDAHEVSELRAIPLRRGAPLDVNDTIVNRPAGPSRLRRAVTLLVAVLMLVPIVMLLPAVARSPELAPARAWSLAAMGRAQASYQQLRARAHELWMKEPDDSSRPGQRP